MLIPESDRTGLDCGRYNEFGVHPGQLLIQNDDRLFPEFQGQDLTSQGPARLEHRARDGATVNGLPSQVQGLRVEGKAIALITIGGNDLLSGLIRDTGAGIKSFGNSLDTFVQQLPIRPVLLGNVYDPTFKDDNRNFLGVEPAIARKNLQRMNTTIQEIANRYGQLVDLHAHFLKGASMIYLWLSTVLYYVFAAYTLRAFFTAQPTFQTSSYS